MSRRRATEESTPVEDEEDGLPPPSTDSANGKVRTPAERAGRFFRTRPVSSLLLLFALIALSLVTFSLGKTIGRTLSHMLYGSDVTSAPALSAPAGGASMAHARDGDRHTTGNDVRNAVNAGTVAGNDTGGGSAARKEEENDDGVPPAADERGAILDGPETHDLPIIHHEEARPKSKNRVCYRKFEPGKLGSKKTLCVTDEFFFDISIGEVRVGRFKIGVFGEVVPKSVANFRALVTCSGVFADDSLCYRGDSFHRVVTNFVAQGGSKATGRSIYGPTFREERSGSHHSFLEHSEKGVVSWAEYPIGSQFFILIRNEAKYLDDNHVVFGIVTDGLEVVDKIHNAPRNGEEPSTRVTITDCGDAHRHV